MKPGATPRRALDASGASARASRASVAHRFLVLLTRAEEMYHPETFGRSASERVIVEAAEGR